MSLPSTDRTTHNERGAAFIAAPGAVVAGRYELVALLGRGAAGSVWEARHRVLASRVALKLLDAHVGRNEAEAAELLERFRFEAQISASLGTTVRNVIAVHDAGAHDGVPFLAMELVRGESLEERIVHGPYDSAEIPSVLNDLAEALDGLHARGIAHRDLKPANVLCVTGEGPSPRTNYKLADFGVAKMFGEALSELVLPKQTATNMLVGTPAYMSPEYLGGGGSVDGSGDLWALAVVAYELLTGHLPFDGAQWTAVAVAISQGEFEPPSKLLGRRVPSLDGFFARALAPRAEHRYASAGELARAFVEAMTRDAAIAAMQPSAGGVLERGSVDPPSPMLDGVAGEPGASRDGNTRAAPDAAARRRFVPVFLIASVAAIAAIGGAVFVSMDTTSHETAPESLTAGSSSPLGEQSAAVPSAEAEEPPRLEAPQPAAPIPSPSARPSGPRREAARAVAPSRVPQAPPSVEVGAPTPVKRPARALPKEEVF